MKQIPSIGERNYYDEKQMDCGIDRMLHRRRGVAEQQPALYSGK